MNASSTTTVTQLSLSDRDDHAPYIPERADYVVFASNRDGGLGEYDLYCAPFDRNGRLGKPVHLAYASSPYKDFRPVVVRGHYRDVLVFSSNRPGGKGGMDLYYVSFEGCGYPQP